MKSIPGYPGHAWEITATADDGRALKVRFAPLRGGALTSLLRKQARAANDPAAPWVLRYWSGSKEVWRRVSPDAPAPWLPDGIIAACRNALDELQRVASARDPYSAARAAAAYRAKLTLTSLADEWRGLGMPSPSGTPRTPDQQKRTAPFLATALEWWGPRDPASVTQRTMRDYHAQRSASTERAGCSRSVDLELVALSNLCTWAVADERLQVNPFAQRPRFRAATAVRHSSERMPASDEDLHAITRWLLDQPGRHQVAGGYLLLQALTGLRPGEPAALRLDAQLLAHGAEPGHIWSHPDGRQFLAVRRTKSGVNPGVVIHPALAQFLAAWLPHARASWPGSPWWFPDPLDPAKSLIEFGDSHLTPTLSRSLAEACEATGRPKCSPHGMRAFFTRCCISAGDDFATVAAKLGQRSGAALVAKAYSHMANVVGDGRFDWLSTNGQAWASLQKPTNILAPVFGNA